jgi:hypothetical protein
MVKPAKWLRFGKKDAKKVFSGNFAQKQNEILIFKFTERRCFNKCYYHNEQGHNAAKKD